ncbi:hypothetical protein B0682_06240 [Moraxella lincolnii]|uniref:OmpA-like domain-containing protein n=1 Tax=Lwoffella lincolnii TaxID=90241 RepID=A0A1T0CEL0_9GAMM|nr:hypothetical protein B0682_06240 [Moraxella lincolnii]
MILTFHNFGKSLAKIWQHLTPYQPNNLSHYDKISLNKHFSYTDVTKYYKYFCYHIFIDSFPTNTINKPFNKPNKRTIAINTHLNITAKHTLPEHKDTIMKTTLNTKLLITTLAGSMALVGCAADPTGQTTINKTALGTLAGATLGAGVSKATGGERTGRDAAIGAAIGAGVGYYMQRQEQQLKQQMAGTGVEVALDPRTNDINLVMPSNITFDTDKTYIKPTFTNTLDKLAATMNEYGQTTVVIMGHTDSVGDAGYNQGLSERRAFSVASYLNNRGVSSHRISTVGYGESQPIADNNTEYGKAQNRRVEIKINAPQNIQQSSYSQSPYAQSPYAYAPQNQYYDDNRYYDEGRYHDDNRYDDNRYYHEREYYNGDHYHEGGYHDGSHYDGSGYYL